MNHSSELPSTRGQELKHAEGLSAAVAVHVALYARAGIETGIHIGEIPELAVALYARAGIETLPPATATSGYDCCPLREGRN
ncbi:protein of unknown function [Ruminococcaceae bacterium BL-6]|nr:protein of unknown function [Ruminococcaceae bacterium BL-6]